MSSPGLDMIIKIMKNNYYQASPRLDMIIKVMKNNDYQASPELNMIIQIWKIIIIKRVQDSTW